jgi:hypothetical protein
MRDYALCKALTVERTMIDYHKQALGEQLWFYASVTNVSTLNRWRMPEDILHMLVEDHFGGHWLCSPPENISTDVTV